ncbi:unnamed protein product [Fusarium graminearum]|nr:unnamed protein product [Fusarium graminearum]
MELLSRIFVNQQRSKATTSPTPTTTTASVGQCWDDEGAEAVPVSVLVWAKASVNDAVTAAQGDDG